MAVSPVGRELFHITLDGVVYCKTKEAERFPLACVYSWRLSADQAIANLRRLLPGRKLELVPGNCPGH